MRKPDLVLRATKALEAENKELRDLMKWILDATMCATCSDLYSAHILSRNCNCRDESVAFTEAAREILARPAPHADTWNLWLMDWHEIPTGVTTYVAKHFEGNGLGHTIAIVFSPAKEDSDGGEPITAD